MSDRREFLTGLIIVSPQVAFGSQANSAIELGLIGCGGRGNYIGDFFREYTGSRIVAVADAFQAPLDKAQAKYSSAKAYVGVKGYEELVAGKLDAVVIESPPFFHPEQAEAAVKAGKHVFVAKPVATDAPGCKQFAAAGERAKGKLSFLVDFQTRAQAVFQEAASRVHRGDIGTLAFGHVYYHAGRVGYHQTPGMNAEDALLRNWLHDRRLSGDIIVEQNVHVLDVANWYLRSTPLKALGTCGRKVRLDGNVSDNYSVTYWYPNDVKVSFSSCQFLKGYSDLCIRVYGSEGTCDSHYNGMVKITGAKPWDGAEKDPTFKEGAIANVKAFVESIRSGKYLNNAGDAADSTLTAVLGRMAAYRERIVTWDEMMRNPERFDGRMKG